MWFSSWKEVSLHWVARITLSPDKMLYVPSRENLYAQRELRAPQRNSVAPGHRGNPDASYSRISYLPGVISYLGIWIIRWSLKIKNAHWFSEEPRDAVAAHLPERAVFTSQPHSWCVLRYRVQAGVRGKLLNRVKGYDYDDVEDSTSVFELW